MENSTSAESKNKECPKNHEVIRLAQLGVSQPYKDSNPTEVEVYECAWIYATREVGEYPSPTERSGKWLVFANADEVDEIWARIREATRMGRLGHSSKVRVGTDDNSRVICVYTYDWQDEHDVRRVRDELRKLGFTDKLSYKADQDTLDGKYSHKGYKKISKYRE